MLIQRGIAGGEVRRTPRGAGAGSMPRVWWHAQLRWRQRSRRSPAKRPTCLSSLCHLHLVSQRCQVLFFHVLMRLGWFSSMQPLSALRRFSSENCCILAPFWFLYKWSESACNFLDSWRCLHFIIASRQPSTRCGSLNHNLHRRLSQRLDQLRTGYIVSPTQ